MSAENSRPATRSEGSSQLRVVHHLRAGSTPASSHSEDADGVAGRLEEREAHGAADQHGVGALQERLEHADLVRHLRAADHGHQRPPRVLEDAVQRRHLALEQPPGGARQQVRHALGGGVRAVRRAERVVDVDVGERRVALGQRRVVLRLARRRSARSPSSRSRRPAPHPDRAPAAHPPRAARTAGRPRAAARTSRRGPSAARDGRAGSSRAAPRSRSSRSVGSAARIRASSVMFRSSSRGTLKSTRTRTRLPSTSRSSSVRTHEHLLGELDAAVRVAPLVVVPGDDLDQVALEHRRQLGVEDRAVGDLTMSEETSGSSV